MPPPLPLRDDFDASHLRTLARTTKDAGQTRRLLALATIYEGACRTEAARMGGVTLQIIRDWVLKFNADGPEGLVTHKAPGQPCLLNDGHRKALMQRIDAGPDLDLDGVVRWRIVDLCQWISDTFALRVSTQTLSRELRALGYRRLSTRPRHHAQTKNAVSDFKKNSRLSFMKSQQKKALILPT